MTEQQQPTPQLDPEDVQAAIEQTQKAARDFIAAITPAMQTAMQAFGTLAAAAKAAGLSTTEDYALAPPHDNPNEAEHATRGCTGSWEQHGRSRKCADCKRPMAAAEQPTKAGPTPFECEPGNRCNRCAVCWS